MSKQHDRTGQYGNRHSKRSSCFGALIPGGTFKEFSDTGKHVTNTSVHVLKTLERSGKCINDIREFLNTVIHEAQYANTEYHAEIDLAYNGHKSIYELFAKTFEPRPYIREAGFKTVYKARDNILANSKEHRRRGMNAQNFTNSADDCLCKLPHSSADTLNSLPNTFEKALDYILTNVVGFFKTVDPGAYSIDRRSNKLTNLIDGFRKKLVLANPFTNSIDNFANPIDELGNVRGKLFRCFRDIIVLFDPVSEFNNRITDSSGYI